MELTHLNKKNNPKMVDVGDKNITTRTAIASGKIYMSSDAFLAVKNASGKKGAVIQTAIIAGVMAVKNTSSVIPMCHNININKVEIDINELEDKNGFIVICEVKCDGKTGVEMEALHGVSVSLLTIYDMVKAIDKAMILDDIKLEKKTGGKSDFKR